MAFPFLAAALAVGAGAAAVKGYEWWRTHHPASSTPAMTVATLDKGKSYAILAQVTPAIATKDPVVATANLTNAFQASGFTVLTPPTPRSQDELALFQSGDPRGSTWAMTARWNLDDKVMSSPISFVSSALFTLLPIQS